LPIARPTMSFEPPTANGTISVICLEGYVCARPAALVSTSAAARKAPILIMTGFSRRLRYRKRALENDL
jgi:hypothetical protein